MSELIPILQRDGALVADSREIATALGVQHKNLLETIQAHLATMESEFGRVAFETGTLQTGGGPQETRFAYLTEDQALFVATLSRNTAAVVRVKAWLVKAFATARNQLAPVPALPTNYAAALRALAAEVEEKERLALENATLSPKAAFFDAVADSKDAVEMGAAANVLAVPGYGRTNLFRFLRERKILQRDNRPYQEFIDREYFRVIEQKWTGSDGSTHISFKTLVYQRGLDFIRRRLAEDGNLAVAT